MSDAYLRVIRKEMIQYKAESSQKEKEKKKGGGAPTCPQHAL